VRKKLRFEDALYFYEARDVDVDVDAELGKGGRRRHGAFNESIVGRSCV